MFLSDLYESLYLAILEADIEEANNLIAKAIELSGYDLVLSDLISPILKSIGEEWGKGKVALAQGYVAGKVMEEFLLSYNQSLPKTLEKNEKIVVIGNIEDDYHSLGRRMITVFLKSYGWYVIDLGNDVTAKEFVDTALEYNAHVIAASAMMYTTAQNIITIREELHKRGVEDSIKLAVGGAVFLLREELVEEVGGDGTAPNAIAAVTLIERLHYEALGETHE